jgi:3-hexulose-6-phosphate synthase
VPQGLAVAEATLEAGVTISELGTPLLKYEASATLREANAVFSGGGNIIDFVALAGGATAKAVCVRCVTRSAGRSGETPRLAFADVLVPMQGPAGQAVETAEPMLAAGVERLSRRR